MGKPLLDVLRDVVTDPGERALFAGDPSRYLAQHGYEDVSPDDLSEAFGLVADTLPPDVAQAVAETAPPVPTSPVDELDDPGSPGEMGDLGDPVDLGSDALGDVGQGFDAFAAGSDGADLDDPDHLDDDPGPADFGTGEVAAVAAGHDDGAFGEGSEVGSGFPGGYDDTPTDPDDIDLDDGVDLPAEHPGGYDDTPIDPDDVHIPEDGDDIGDGFGDHLGDDGGELPDDPGDFLDDIGSF